MRSEDDIWEGVIYDFRTDGGGLSSPREQRVNAQAIKDWSVMFTKDRPNDWFVVVSTPDLFVMRWLGKDPASDAFRLEIYWPQKGAI